MPAPGRMKCVNASDGSRIIQTNPVNHPRQSSGSHPAPMQAQPDPRPDSPCIGVCSLDEAQICIGCLRHVQEITWWTRLTPAQQWAVVGDLPRRRAALEPGE
jgi:predicted Fe-S protein YdhL (DUF1289 family)